MAFESQNLDRGSVESQWGGSPKNAGSLMEELELNLSPQSTDATLENTGLADPNVNADVKSVTEETPTKEGGLLEDTVKPDVTEKPATTATATEIDEKFKSAINSLVEEGILDGFENYEIKTIDDVKELIVENIKDKTQAINENIFQETLESLPAQFQSVIKYGLSGGTNIQELLESWKDVEQAYNVDISTDAGKEQVVRDYLTLSNYGTPEMIEQDIKTWKDLGTLDAKANVYKPQLENHYMERVAYKEREAQDQMMQEEQYYQQYTAAVGQVLGAEDLNGLVLDNKTKQYIYENSQPIYRSQLTGKPVDALQAAIEDLKFGQNANPTQYAEAILAITQPEVYKEILKTQLKTELAMATEKKLRKQVQSDVTGSSVELDKTKTKSRQEPLTW